MEIQKFRIKRINPDIHWDIPCSGGTNFWPINTSINCSGITMYNTTGVDVMSAINGDILNTFPEELKHCSPTDPCVILWNTGPASSPNHCTSSDGFLYVLFKGLNVTLSGITHTDSFDLTRSVISIGQTSISPVNITPNTFGCECESPLGQNVSKIPIFISQDFNDIGHYSLWDGNISQQDVFANFVFSGVSSGGMQVLVSNTTDFGYYETFQKSPFTIDWGEFGNTTQILYYPSLTTQSLYTYTNPGKYTITITQDTPWGPISSSKVIVVPLETYAVMAGSPISSLNLTLQMDQANPVLGPTGFVGNAAGGSSTGYFNSYPDMPLDSATHINEYSGMTFGPGSQGGQPCFTVSGVTDSILGNFQTYTSLSTANLPPGYNAGVTVPIGGDVLDPITNSFLTGVYGTIEIALPMYTAYTISSAANSTGTADGDTPIRFWDFNNGITIFEATSCGLDNLAWGAEECIACPSGDCEYCTTKDEYVDRVTGVPHSIGPGVVVGDWSPSGNYSIGDIVYDVTFNSCCCYMAVTNISSSDPWFGTAPVMMEEGTYNDAGVYTHVWEACSPECVSCPPGTNTPCNDYSLTSFVYSPGNFYNAGDFVEGEYGNCYQALVSGTLDPPTGYTMQYTSEWDYIGCVSWICPTEGPEANCDSDCITAPPINGVWSIGQMNSSGFGWLGGPYQQGFNFYFENDTVTYNGVCYLCLQSNIGPVFPCSFNSGNGEPDTSTFWQACPLATAQNLECIMISGATLDTFDQFGFPITVTGEMFWADCDANLSGGTCFENRWKCTDQFSCLGCEPIDSSDPLYFTPLSFDSEADCLDYCEPPAYSCTTPTAVGVNCCSEISCFINSVNYINTMISVGAASTTPIDLAYNNGLFLSPLYSMNDCNNGILANTINNSLTPPVDITPNGAILECCINTIWTWDCENGCTSMGGLPTPGATVGSEDPPTTLWATSADCENNMLIYYGVANVVGDVACSWWCEDPFLPYVAPTPGPYQSPCIPCYSLSMCPPYPLTVPGGAGPFPDELSCVTGCSQTATCWTCDCNVSPPCVDSYPDPCPTLISQNPDVYGPDDGGGLNGIPSYETGAECMTACTCEWGWDCFADTGQTPSVNVGCQQGISWNNINALNWQPSDPDPNFTGYSTYTACCYANQGCCYAKCDDDPASNLNINTYPPTGIPTPLGDWPCSYEISLFVQPGPPAGCNDPTVFGYVYDPNKPWCFMFDCTNALCPPVAPATEPTCCDPADETCDCACLPPVNSMGAWNSLFPGYDMNDAVYWGDTDTDFCCFKCHCDYLGAPFTPGDPTTYDCNHFTPGDPAHMGVPNCWRSCNQTPGDPPIPFPWQGTLYNPCSACTSDFDPGYSCTPDGCQNIGCNPTLGTGHLFNCYNSSNCDDFGAPECEAQCYCPPQAGPCISDCITLQQELISGISPVPTDCPPNVYSYISYNECMGINPVNALLPDCCPKPEDQWYCDDSDDCSSNYPPVVNVDGTGCVQISVGHPQYQDPITTNFTSLTNCQAECNWCCDPNGVTVCTFVGNVANCAGTSYIDALGCYLATSTDTPCDCSKVPDEFWCHYDYANNVGGCVSNILGLADVNLIGTGQLDRATDPTAYFPDLISCQAACQFCCDCDITGECYLNWYCNALNPGGGTGCDCHDCYSYLADCAVNEEPCVVLPPDYYCDDILGCTTYPIVNTLIVGPFTGPTALADCQEQCQFECNDNCQCEVTTTQVNPVPGFPPPCYTLACCLFATANNKRCCECEKCIGDHPYSYDNGTGTLITQYVTVTGADLFNVPNWNSTGPYYYGDVVTQDGCCYIMVLNSADWSSYNTTMLPSDYYNLYMNALNTSGLPQYGIDLMWIPCDPDCPPVVYEERWWCDDNNPSYPYQETNCIEEYPWIDNQISSNASYGNNVYGHDGSGNQVSYNNGGTPFSSLGQCKEYCKYCCEPEPDPKPCCCCEDDGFGHCVPFTMQSPLNPMNLPCDQACNNISAIECPPEPCCCCKETYPGSGICQPGTQVSMMPVADTPCDQICSDWNSQGIVCDDSCKICCMMVPGPLGGAYYTVQNSGPGSLCKCQPGDTQVGMAYCEPIIINDFDGSGHGSGHHDQSLSPLLRSGNPAEKAKIKQAHSGPQPCCITCQLPSGAQYQVNQPNALVTPCKCYSVTHMNLGPCTPVVAASGPCELDWKCDTCENQCFDSYYSCMTLTNDCTPPTPADCNDCVGTYAEWDYNQDGLFGYYSPITVFAPPQVNMAISTYDGWDGTQTITNTAPVTWASTEPYWNFGQIVLDPNTPGCCWVRNEVHDVNTIANLPPDQYSPSEHWCNFLSGNSADGANMFSPLGGTIVTQYQHATKTKPWWIPCDKKCVKCDTGGTQTLRYKCVDGLSGGIGCTSGYFPWNDLDAFDDINDCNENCWSWLCNSNGYFSQYSKCNNTSHTTVIGDQFDFIDYHIQQANPNLLPMNYVFTYVPPGPNPFWPLPVGSGPNPFYPCPILPPDIYATGYMAAPDSGFLSGKIMNGYNPCSSGGAAPSLGGSSWFDVYTNALAVYNSEIVGCNNFQCVEDVMQNDQCKYTPPGSIGGTPCAAFALAGSLYTPTTYNDSGLFFDPTNPGQPCQVYDATKTGWANQHCCLSYHFGLRPCPCTTVGIGCDCWQVLGTGTTGGPFNIFDYAYPLDDYTGCTQDCCVGTCECCEPNLTSAGYIAPGDTLTYQSIGMSSFSAPPATMTLHINDCIIFPDGDFIGGLGGSTTGPDLSGIWNLPNGGTLSGGCCVCCVAGGSGTDPDPLNDGNPTNGDCFFMADSSDGTGSGLSGTWDIVNFYDYTGQWVSCGVDEICENCGSGGVAPLG